MEEIFASSAYEVDSLGQVARQVSPMVPLGTGKGAAVGRLMNAAINDRIVKIKANDFSSSDLLAYVRGASDLEQKILLKFDQPLVIGNITYSHAVISPRLARDDIRTLLSKGALGCAVTWVPAGRFDPTKPFDVSWWRGGAAAVADAVLT